MSKTDVDPETGEILPAADTDTELEAYRHHLETLQPEDPEAIQERILRQILKATTAEDIINAGAAVNTDKVLDMPMTVLSIRAGESTFKDGPDRFLIVDAIILSNGDKVTFSTSARCRDETHRARHAPYAPVRHPPVTGHQAHRRRLLPGLPPHDRGGVLAASSGPP